MIRLLVIADDITGALDTGVHFSGCGAVTRVVLTLDGTLPSCDVLVFDAETRHLLSHDAYQKVFQAVRRAIDLGIRYIYKKTDSALRGNIGSELAALLDASVQAQLPFFPAYPKMNRCTIGGVHYIDNVPVSQSVFGKDPFEPVTTSFIPDLIHQETNCPASCCAPLTDIADDIPSTSGILVFDGSSDEELRLTGKRFFETGKQFVFAGCAGFASVLPDLIGFAGMKKAAPPAAFAQKRLLVVCGSVNPITQAQLDAAEPAGFYRYRISPDRKLNPGSWNCPEGSAELDHLARQLGKYRLSILDSNDADENRSTKKLAARLQLSIEDVRQRISQSIGILVQGLVDRGIGGAVLVTGGDTFVEYLKRMDVTEIEPVCEFFPGVVLSNMGPGGHRYIISKSGGFGDPKLFIRLAERLGIELDGSVDQ